MTTRAEAIAAGLKRYLGEPCPDGHHGERYTSNGMCAACTAAKTKQWRDDKKNGRPRAFVFKGRDRPVSLAERVMRRKDRALPQLREAPGVVPLLLPLDELPYDGCRYPYGDSGNYIFCGNPKAPTGPYCQPHAALAYLDRVPRSLTVPSSLAV